MALVLSGLCMGRGVILMKGKDIRLISTSINVRITFLAYDEPSHLHKSRGHAWCLRELDLHFLL